MLRFKIPLSGSAPRLALAAALVYSPWTKECPKGKFGGGCVLTSEARRENGDFVASAVVVQQDGGKTLGGHGFGVRLATADGWFPDQFRPVDIGAVR